MDHSNLRQHTALIVYKKIQAVGARQEQVSTPVRSPQASPLLPPELTGAARGGTGVRVRCGAFIVWARHEKVPNPAGLFLPRPYRGLSF